MAERDRKLKLNDLSQEARAAKDLLKSKLRPQPAIARVKFYRKFGLIVPELGLKKTPELMANPWYYNGFVLDLQGKLTVVDPGPGFLQRFNQSELDLAAVNAIILSHWHLDHAYDLGFCLEKLAKFKHLKLELYLPFPGYSEELLPYFQGLIAQKIGSGDWKLFLIDDTESAADIKYKIDELFHIEFFPLKHSAPNFGFKLHLGKGRTVGYLSDTGYSEKVRIERKNYPVTEIGQKVYKDLPELLKTDQGIKDFYSDCDVLVTNLNDLAYNRHSAYHLSGWDLAHILAGSKVRKVILQHLSTFQEKNLHQYAEFLATSELKQEQIILPQAELLRVDF